MQLWLLKARDDLPEGEDPWGYSPFDKVYALIVRAAVSLHQAKSDVQIDEWAKHEIAFGCTRDGMSRPKS